MTEYNMALSMALSETLNVTKLDSSKVSCQRILQKQTQLSAAMY